MVSQSIDGALAVPCSEDVRRDCPIAAHHLSVPATAPPADHSSHLTLCVALLLITLAFLIGLTVILSIDGTSGAVTAGTDVAADGPSWPQ